MTPATSLAAFEQRLLLGGRPAAALTASEGVEAMLAFYAAERCDGCDLEEDGDMLLFQWGTYSWGGSTHFELNITRQLMPGGGDEDEDDDEGILQLSLTFRFPPAAELQALGSGNEWCATPSGLPAFRAHIDACPAFERVDGQVPSEVVLHLGSV
ncbi:hypothetical protein [Polaromonas sp. LjRoot131]|uniref:hypothetical protein n=1 Tax=Polaromonas sp. LjRoot131 TaxID=3342262 RepID=UPI003ED0D622